MEPYRSFNYILNNFTIYSGGKMELPFRGNVIIKNITSMDMCCCAIYEV